jgi:hypothetical protein
MKTWHPLLLTATFFLVVGSVLHGQQKEALSDLSLSNFFSDGWDETWSKRSRGDGTPDMSLLRVQTNFLVQLLRVDTYLETGMNAPAERSEFTNATIEYAFNRRLLLAFFLGHQWIESAGGKSDRDGPFGGLFTRFQLADTAHSSLALNLKMTLPNTDLGEHATTWSYALAGWQDLQTLGLGRTGLYYHVQHEIAGGPVPGSNARNDVTYDLSLAHSWTGPGSTFENLTTFVEAYGKSLLDGDHTGRTIVSLTPGFRFTLGKKHIFMAGVDLPLAGPRSFDALYRLTYIFNF